MFDLHCHILPGIDDGPASIEESILMAEKAVSQGISHILATPHHKCNGFFNPKWKVIDAVENLQKELDFRNIKLNIIPGQEVRITGDLLEDIYYKDEIIFFGSSNKYMLIEFPSSHVPYYADQILEGIIDMGKVPIIVHPQRNSYFIRNRNQLTYFIEMGCLTQLTAPSYMGIYGKTIQKAARKMVKKGLIHFMASDAHGQNKRNFYLEEGYYKIQKDFNVEKVNKLKHIAKSIVLSDAIFEL